MPYFNGQLFPFRKTFKPHLQTTTPRRAPITAEQFKSELFAVGKTIRQWALEHDFRPDQVYRTLNGVDKAEFGRSHDIAVAAGIK